jgi:pyruvate dehydrogenase E2 component (dihydrolipoamide acetyltransferase)
MAELPLTMPKMSMTMEEGTMVAWLKQEGDAVRAGEPICEVATDKVDMEVESPFDGVLVRIVGQPDEVYSVGDTIGFITTDADDLLGGLFDAPGPAASVAAAVAAASSDLSLEDTAVGAEAFNWVSAVPAARALADERHVNLSLVTPTGPWNTVRYGDVEAAVGSPPALAVTPVSIAEPVDPAPINRPIAVAQPTVFVAESNGTQPVPASVPASVPALVSALAEGATATAPVDPTQARRRRTRLQVAKVMSLSAAVPQFTAYIDLNLEKLSAVRKTTLAGASWTAILVRAQAIALSQHPTLNGTWSDSGVVPNEHIGIALAIDSPTGLIAPVLKNSHEGSLAELVAEIASVVEAAKSGTLPSDRLGGGTSVFSNLGGFGVESFNALLTPPQSTALSSGSVKQRLQVFEDGSFGPRLTCTIGLTVDHRVADGADAARMLATIRGILSDAQHVL